MSEPAPRPRADVPTGRAALRTVWQRGPFQLGFLAVLGGLLALGLVDALRSLSQIIVLVILSLFLALGLNPVVERLSRRGRLPRPVAVALAAVVLLAVLVLGSWALIPVLTEQLANLYRNAPSFITQLRENTQIARFDAQFGVIDQVTAALRSGGWVNLLFGGLVGAGQLVAGTLFSVIMTLVLTLYFLASLPQIKDLIYQLAPASRRPRVRYLANEMFNRIGGYLTGMFVAVSLWALTAFLMLNLIGLGTYSLALAIVVAGFAFIPVVGWLFSLAIVSLIALSFSPTAGLVAVGYFLVYSQLDAYFVQPRIFSRSLNVPPPLVILGAISGGLLLGIVGALLAIPTVASLMLLYREVLVPRLDAS